MRYEFRIQLLECSTHILPEQSMKFQNSFVSFKGISSTCDKVIRKWMPTALHCQSMWSNAYPSLILIIITNLSNIQKQFGQLSFPLLTPAYDGIILNKNMMSLWRQEWTKRITSADGSGLIFDHTISSSVIIISYTNLIEFITKKTLMNVPFLFFDIRYFEDRRMGFDSYSLHSRLFVVFKSCTLLNLVFALISKISQPTETGKDHYEEPWEWRRLRKRRESCT